MSICGIYSLTNNLTGKIYIGSSADIARRIRKGHVAKLNGGRHDNRYLQAAWDRDGEQAFTWRVLCEVPADNLLKTEQLYLDVLKPFANTGTGYNLAKVAGSPMAGNKHTAEAKAKASASHKNNPASVANARAQGLKKAKTCRLISPNGEAVTVTNLSQFSRDNNLDLAHLSRVTTGKLRQHKGYYLAA